MDYSKLLEILTITVPVFALAGIGKLLRHCNVISATNQTPLNWITYYLALPALIFVSFIEKGPSTISISALLCLSLLPILFASLFVLFLTFSRKKHFEPEKMNAAVYLSYWGNNGYMGIPLVISTIGISEGLPLAAVINGLSVPFYISFSMVLMYKAKNNGPEREYMKDAFIHHTLLNPVILAMIFGAILSAVRPNLPVVFTENDIVLSVYHITVQLLKQLGSMGLPLALILVGSNLNLKEIRSDKYLLGITVVGKLIIAPATVYFLAFLLFPDLQKTSFQALVLMNAVPGAVASYIISSKFNCAEEFVSSSLVLTTLFSIFTIPIWLHIIL